MNLKLRNNSRLAKQLGPSWTRLLETAVNSLERILPHVETSDWRVLDSAGTTKTRATFAGQQRRSLNLSILVRVNGTHWSISGVMRRRSVLAGVGAIERTIDLREKDIADCLLAEVSEVMQAYRAGDATTPEALQSGLEERVIARHLKNHHAVQINLAKWFAALRKLAEQSYENKALTFGCVVRTDSAAAPLGGAEFPEAYLERKRYRALSDGYRTVYEVSARGAVTGFADLPLKDPETHRYHPSWCDELASHSRAGRMSICLTRQGDVLVLDSGRLTLTYRSGRWQYWNHAHIVDLLANAARVQRVAPGKLAGVVRSIYRAALDVAFRRSGGLFVLLRNRNSLRKTVRAGDAIGDKGRQPIDASFDDVLGDLHVQTGSRKVVAELAALDGAVVMANTGKILAYGAVLDPQSKGRLRAAEGSRTKAAIGASNYGLAVKISSDGDITVYLSGRELIRI